MIPNTVVVSAANHNLTVSRPTGRYRVVVIIGNTATGAFGLMGAPDGFAFAAPIASVLAAEDGDMNDPDVIVTLEGAPVSTADVLRWMSAGAIG